ncbi:MAG: SCO1664 family protein [Chloroflexi bacterium]|nr:SCO1664 family protein [Chloroflexota bacterium]
MDARSIKYSKDEDLSEDGLLELLIHGAILSSELIPWGSNYNFLLDIEGRPAVKVKAIYKPQAGESPLIDFPIGTLYKREYATYVVSKALGWPHVPPTVIREGPHGIGSIQLFIDAYPQPNYFTLRDDHSEVFKQIAIFDILINNADRKAGHCLLGRDNKIWIIDHGLTFNQIFNLRTVIWDFCGHPVPAPLVKNLESLLKLLSIPSQLTEDLRQVLTESEIKALMRRLHLILGNPVFPNHDPFRRDVPWPWL